MSCVAALIFTLWIPCPGMSQTVDQSAAMAPLSPGGPTVPAESASEPSTDSHNRTSTYDRVWKLAEWYVGGDNPIVQGVLFSGRYQHEFAALDADQGDHDESNVRRMRLGWRVTLFHKLLLHAEFDLNPQERDPTYVRFTDMYAQWTHNSQLVVTLGKQAVPFTLEGTTSSKELITIDRSNLANNIWFPQEYAPGFSVAGTRGAWTYRGGVYSSGAANREFGEFNGGVFALGVIGYDFARRLGVNHALLTANYVHQRPNPNNSFTRQLDHIVSTNFKLEERRWGVWADFSAASGYDSQSNLWAFMALPFFNATERLQFVTRYTYVKSPDRNGLRLDLYEERIVSSRGDEYKEYYVGANYYFYGHNLKLQSGLHWADMLDRAKDGGAYSGVSWITGLRVGW